MPNESLKGLSTPNTGDLTGAWGTSAVNPNMQVIGGYLGGVASVSLTNANVSLSISSGVIGTGSITPGAGPVQAANAVIKFSGTLTGNCVITFPCPGFWIVKNNCTVGAFYVQARAVGTGNVIGLPPGEAVHVYNDGTDCDFVDLGRVGSYIDLAAATTPAWMSACTVLPYLPCVGTATYSSSIYVALNAMLGSTFGGNGITTFAPPDLSGRGRIPIDFTGTRITSGGSGINGGTFGASGGSQLSEGHTHLATVTDPGHPHNTNAGTPAVNGAGRTGAGGDLWFGTVGNPSVLSNTTGITVANATTGAGTSGNVQPSLVAGIAFIKT